MAVCWQPSRVCPKSCPEPCLPRPPHYSGPGCDDSCLAPCRAEALKAGEATMASVLAAWPQAQMFSMFGPWLSTPLTHQHVPFISDFAKENPIVGSFLVGWISALQKHRRRQAQQHDQQALFLDGSEAYGASNLSDILTMKR